MGNCTGCSGSGAWIVTRSAAKRKTHRAAGLFRGLLRRERFFMPFPPCFRAAFWEAIDLIDMSDKGFAAHRANVRHFAAEGGKGWAGVHGVSPHKVKIFRANAIFPMLIGSSGVSIASRSSRSASVLMALGAGGRGGIR